MSQSGLEEPGKINVSKIGEHFQRKLREPQKWLRKICASFEHTNGASLGEFNVALWRNQFMELVSLDKSVNEKPKQL